MTPDELTQLTEKLLTGALTRQQVVSIADERLPGPYYPTPMVQDPKTQLELMLLNATQATEPHGAGGWWFRDQDFAGALLELHRSSDAIDLGEGWRLVWAWPEQSRAQWEFSCAGPSPSELIARGARLLRHVSDPGLGERADLVSPRGQRVRVLWCIRPSDPANSAVVALGDHPPEQGLAEVLGLLRVDLDNASLAARTPRDLVDLDVGPLLPSAHRVLRLDDNGNTFRVGRFATRAAAEAVAKRFEDRGHKQSYWSEPA